LAPIHFNDVCFIAKFTFTTAEYNGNRMWSMHWSTYPARSLWNVSTLTRFTQSWSDHSIRHRFDTIRYRNISNKHHACSAKCRRPAWDL